MDFEHDDSCCIDYWVRLPSCFWYALKEVRDYWIRNEWFQDLLYHPHRGDKELRRAFDYFDTYLRWALDNLDQAKDELM